MTLFTNDEDGYLRWVLSNPTGFVANFDVPQRIKNYPMVHLSSHHAMTTAKRGNYTTNQYRKACAEDITELEAWARSSFGKALTPCRVCFNAMTLRDSKVGTQSAVGTAQPLLNLVTSDTKRTSIKVEPQGSHNVRLTRPASIVRQGSLTLYTTSFPVKDLKLRGFYAIEKLDPAGAGTGYQRLLNEGRAKRLAEYLVDGLQENDAFLPTSIFLATSKNIPFDDKTNTITFDVAEVGPFNVVDGQHRIAGLIMAAERDAALLDFEVPVNIAVNLDDISQMCHFLIVNTTQRSVDKAIEQQIVARLTQMTGLKALPTIPRWIRRQVEKGEDERAIKVANFLNTDVSSPWRGKIRMANDESDGGTINQKSFINSLKKYVFSANNPLSGTAYDSTRPAILSNYWAAVVDLLVDDSEVSTVIYKTTGVDLFHMVSATVFTQLAARRDFKVDSIKSTLQHGLDNLPDESRAMAHPEWWHRGQAASGVNSAAVRKLAASLSYAINVRDDASEVAL